MKELTNRIHKNANSLAKIEIGYIKAVIISIIAVMFALFVTDDYDIDEMMGYAMIVVVAETIVKNTILALRILFK